jgi:hypothetical protein
MTAQTCTCGLSDASKCPWEGDERAADCLKTAGYGAVLVDFRDLEVRDVEWHDDGFLPKGQLAILQGHGGVNKGTLACQWAAMLSKRGEFVLFVVAEDDYQTTLKPRLVAAGADFEHIRAVDFKRGGQEDALRLPDDLAELQRVIEQTGAVLVVIDPLMTHLSAQVDSYRDHDVKIALRPLAKLAASSGCTILGVHHFTKDTGKGARHSGQASGAFGNTARVVLALASDDEDEMLRVLEVVKCNIGQDGLRRSIRIDLVQVEGLEKPVPVTVFAGHALKTVDELLASRKTHRVPRTAVQDLVLRELATGDKTRHHLDEIAALELGINADSLYKSGLEPLRQEGRIKGRKDGFTGGWLWKMDEQNTKMDDGFRAPHPTSPHPVQDVYPSSENKPKNRAEHPTSIFEDGYPRTQGQTRSSA